MQLEGPDTAVADTPERPEGIAYRVVAAGVATPFGALIVLATPFIWQAVSRAG